MFFRKIKLVLNNADEKSQKTLLFAAKELQKYLRKGCNGDFPVIPVESIEDAQENTIFLGINIDDSIPSVENRELDDAIFISIKDYSGTITGNNARSVLIAVYRFLKEIGFYFLRPGEDNEIIPEITEKCDVLVNEAAKNRHRGVCIEGSVYQENLCDLMDWLPKVGMNLYYVQFKTPKAFLDRHYKRTYKEELTNDETSSLMSLVEEEIEKRSILYEAVGHGWTCDALGISGTSWDKHDEDSFTDEQKSYLALIDGKRGLFKNSPMNTNLCYSNKVVRDKMTDAVVEYSKKHPNIDYLSVGLADEANNKCECENCKKLRVSDYYVMLLNELDEKLTKANLDTRIVFHIYNDLLWIPLETRFNNPDRFVMEFPPITRSYTTHLDPEAKGETREYIVNHNVIPNSVEENLAYLREWQGIFKSDSYIFDYHFMWEHYCDFSYIGVSEILYKDICNLDKLKLKGYMSCQPQRTFLPTGLGMHTCAQTLWNTDLSFDDITNEVLSNEFGKEYTLVKDYLKNLHKYGCSKAARGEENLTSEENKEKLKKAIDIIDEFRGTVESMVEKAELPVQKKYWQGLLFHGKFYKSMLNFYLALQTEDEEDAYNKMIETSQEGAVEFKEVFDACLFPGVARFPMRGLFVARSLSCPK